MTIRHADPRDLENILSIYDDARSFMRAAGNKEQWSGGYPSLRIVEEDIALQRLYVLTEADEILAVFCYFHGADPTYLVIEGGEWQSECEYGVIHRIAVSEKAHGRGICSKCFAYALDRSGSVRIDTHKDNIPMQKALAKFGFVYCGIIHLANGDERLAYQICK
jgi:RimJ/RimL family protein N-acetyltransferase